MEKPARMSACPARVPSPSQAGVTLMELMIVVVIVGILASVAYPAFRDQALRSARADAKGALVEALARQEQYFLDNKTYASSLASLNLSSSTEGGYYTLSIDAATSGCPITRCYGMRATPAGRQADDTVCAVLTVNSAGVKSATGSSPANCW